MATGSRMLDILAVGAGQAGLALGYHLKTTPFTFQIVDCHRWIGDSWRKRYDSLVLFTPRAYSALPGLPVPGTSKATPRLQSCRHRQYCVPFPGSRLHPAVSDEPAETRPTRMA